MTIRPLTRDAVLSPNGKFRYSLSRGWGSGPPVLWCMLNPSTADAQLDDATIRKCMGFTDRWGYMQMTVVNVYAYRATDPKDLATAGYLVGSRNDEFIEAAARCAAFAVAAWGQNARKEDARHTAELLLKHLPGKVYTLGLTKDGAPRHPLYRPYEVERLPLRRHTFDLEEA